METEAEDSMKRDVQSLINKDKYQVFVMACRANVPVGFAFHAWFVVNNKGHISRWEILHTKNKNNPSWGYLYLNNEPPFLGLSTFLFSRGTLRNTQFLGFIEGDTGSVAEMAVDQIEKSKEKYPYCHRYFFPGPNSNTYVQWILDSFPSFNIKLSWRFFGRGYKING